MSSGYAKLFKDKILASKALSNEGKAEGKA